MYICYVFTVSTIILLQEKAERVSSEQPLGTMHVKFAFLATVYFDAFVTQFW